MIKTSPTYTKINDGLTHLSFLLWAWMALVFFQERLYSDSGFFISKVIHYETFWMELNRFMRVFSQWLPLTCIKLGFDLRTVLQAYSVGHVVFFYLIYLIARYRYQHHYIGWLLILTQTLGILWGFCAPGYELYYATAFLALFALEMYRNQSGFWHYILLSLFLITMVINYQLIIFMIAGVLLMHFKQYGIRYMRQYVFCCLIILLCFLFKQSLTAHSYEIAKMQNFLHNLTNRSYGWTDYGLPLLKFYRQFYIEVWGLAFVTTILYIRQRKFSNALGFILFLVLTQYIIALTYPGIRHSRYQEQCYYPLIFVACFPLLFQISNQLYQKARWFLSLGFFVLILYRFYAISVHIKPFTHRVDYMHRIAEATQAIEGNKFIMHEYSWNPLFGGTSFTLGMESMLISALSPTRKTIQIIRDSEWDSGANARLLQDSSMYMFSFRSFYDRLDSMHLHKEVNTRYFDFPAGRYQYLSGGAEPLQTIQTLQQNLSIKTYVPRPCKAGEQINFLIKMNNLGKKALSGTQIKIGYHWWKEGKIVHWESYRNPLEIDLQPLSTYYQYVLIDIPKEKGNYELQIDPIAGDSLGWMQYDRRVPVLVN